MITIDQLIERLYWMKGAKVTGDIKSINTFPDRIEFIFSDGTNAEIILSEVGSCKFLLVVMK